jgi:hypothetical protein
MFEKDEVVRKDIVGAIIHLRSVVGILALRQMLGQLSRRWWTFWRSGSLSTPML